MSAESPLEPDLPPVQPHHYQLLCGLALGAIFLVMLEQGLLLFALAVLVLGVGAILVRMRISPLLMLFPLVGGQLFLQNTLPIRRTHAVLDVEDVVLCTAALAYVAGHYRLLSLWSYILPPDPRQRYHRAHRRWCR